MKFVVMLATYFLNSSCSHNRIRIPKPTLFVYYHFCLDNVVSIFQHILNHWEIQVIVNATYAVDTFFFLSGLLVLYTGYKQLLATGGKLNIIKFYLHRYLRLYANYIFILYICKISPF